MHSITFVGRDASTSCGRALTLTCVSESFPHLASQLNLITHQLHLFSQHSLHTQLSPSPNATLATRWERPAMTTQRQSSLQPSTSSSSTLLDIVAFIARITATRPGQGVGSGALMHVRSVAVSNSSTNVGLGSVSIASSHCSQLPRKSLYS